MSPRSVTLAMLLMLAAPGLVSAAPTGEEILQRMMLRRVQGDDAVSVLHVALISRDGDRVTRTVATYRKRCADGWKNLILLREPADVAGSSFLSSTTGPDQLPDMWVYLPQLGRLRQLNARTVGESFMGSDFTYEDVGPPPLAARTHALAGEEDVDGEPTYRVESRPKSADEPYARIVTWVSQTTFLPVKVEYYDRAGALLKAGRFRDVRVVKGIPTPFDIAMENVQTGHRTEIAMLEVDFDRGLDCGLFSRRRLPRAP